MKKKEILRKKIEEERQKLNHLVTNGLKVEDVYAQSLVVDRLLEQYLDCE